MILYFKHVIHIDDFPLNGHPPSVHNSAIFILDNYSNVAVFFFKSTNLLSFCEGFTNNYPKLLANYICLLC